MDKEEAAELVIGHSYEKEPKSVAKQEQEKTTPTTNEFEAAQPTPPAATDNQPIFPPNKFENLPLQ